MRRILPSIIVVVLGISVALALRAQLRSKPATPSPLPSGDYEIAFIHTTTNPQNWERLVAAVFQIRREYPSVQVDASNAFPEQSADIPEIVFTAPGRHDKLRIRWYKLSSEVGNRDWVKALAQRSPPPIAFMGGGSSDRAIELAQALDDQTEWKGQRPLLFITMATADTVIDPETSKPESLINLYKGRTFRGCFTNEAMARAVVDFIRQSPDLKPTGKPDARAYVLAWQDDPYSVDLADQFAERFREWKDPSVPIHTVLDRIGFSVGTFGDPNPPEQEVLNRILPDLASHPNDRSILVLPAAAQPSRRIIRAISADSPLIGKRLVAINGDGVSFNSIYRDGDVAWPVRELSIPLVLFAHQNPVAWTSGGGPADTASLTPLNSTDDVLLFADMIRVVAVSLYIGPHVNDADELAEKLKSGQPSFYMPDGERRAGEGEYVIVLRPQFLEGERVAKEAIFDVYTRKAGRWELVKQLTK